MWCIGCVFGVWRTVKVLDRALFRLASTPDQQFEAALGRILPRVLILLARSSPAIRDVCVTICNHINKRVKVIEGVQFPITDLLAIYAADTEVRRQKLGLTASAASASATATATATAAPATATATASASGSTAMDTSDSTPSVSASGSGSGGSASAAPAITKVVLSEWSAFMSEFTVLYLEKAFAALTPLKRTEYAGLLLDGVSVRPTAQQKTILHIFVSCMGGMDYSAGAEERKSRFAAFISNDADRSLVLSFFSDLLLYTPNQNQMSAYEKKQLAAARAAAGGADANAPAPVTVPTGMSLEAIEFVTRDGKVTYDEPNELTRVKLSVLSFVSSGLFSDNDILAHGLIAASGGDHSVVSKGDDMLRRLRGIDFERSTTQQTLFSLILGSTNDKTVPDNKKRSGASIALKLLILPHLSRSYFAANEHALALKVVFDCLFGQTSPRLKLAGLQFFIWIVAKAAPNKLQNLAPLYVSALLKFLATFNAASAPATPSAADTPTTPTPAPAAATPDTVPRPMGGMPAPNYSYARNSATGQSTLLDAQLKGNTYNALGQLGHKFPALFNTELRMIHLFFKALQEESDNGILQNIHEGLTLLRECYVSSRPELKLQLQQMLLGLAQHDKYVL